jgi:CheY-like chemotaxis protein
MAAPEHSTDEDSTARTILVIDDDPDVRGLLQMALEDAGYRVDVAADGQEALHRLSSRRPDAIVLDLMLPVVDGRQVIRMCRASPYTRDIPIIIVSAVYGGGSNDPELASLVFMAKPFDVDILLILVEDAIGS